MSAESSSNNQSNMDKTSWKETPFLILKGFLMGSADIVPGVSGGTMALITGIYDRLINAIRSFDGKAISNLFKMNIAGFYGHIHWKFLLLLFTGIATAVVFFTRIVPLQVYMFTHPELVYGIFFGLILGSVVLLVYEIDSQDRNWKYSVPLCLGTAFGFWVVTLVPADTPESFVFVFLTGSVAITAMILPGISGSYILLIFRKYDYILSQLGEIGSSETLPAIFNLIPFILGAITGIVVFSRVLSWLLKKYHSVTIIVLIGFLIGSLYVIWPYQEREFQETVRSVSLYNYDDPVVQELRNRETVPNLPEYLRLGQVQEESNQDIAKQVEVEKVSRKLVSSRPLWPWSDGVEIQKSEIIEGIAGMITGFLLIIVVSYLRRKTT